MNQRVLVVNKYATVFGLFVIMHAVMHVESTRTSSNHLKLKVQFNENLVQSSTLWKLVGRRR